MPCPCGFSSCAWSQGSAHPLRNVHYALIFQAVLGFVISILTCYSLANMGWWTGLDFAAGLAHGALRWSASMLTVVVRIFLQTVTAGFLTFFGAPLLQCTITCFKPTDTMWARRAKIAASFLLALAMALLNIFAGIRMFNKPGKDYRHSFDQKPPVGEWWTTVTLLFIQAIISTWCMFKILKFSHDGQRSPENVNDTELENFPLRSAAPDHGPIGLPSPSPEPRENTEDRSSPAQVSPDQLQSRSWGNPFRGHDEPTSDDPDDNAGESSSRPTQMSANARGKQRETLDDGDDALALGLAGMDAGGNAWTPI